MIRVSILIPRRIHPNWDLSEILICTPPTPRDRPKNDDNLKLIFLFESLLRFLNSSHDKKKKGGGIFWMTYKITRTRSLLKTSYRQQQTSSIQLGKW